MNEYDLSRFNCFVDKESSETGCHLWKGRCDEKGRAMFSPQREGGKPASRVIWEHTKGPIDAGLFVLHKCDNNKCVNIEHLFLGTLGQNNHDMIEKGRHSIFGCGIVTEEKLRLIRQELAKGYVKGKTIAAKFGVSTATISMIKHNKVWKNKLEQK